MENQGILFISTDFDLYSHVKILMNREYELVYAAHLSDGLRQFNLRPYDLVIIDLQLVTADRAELLRALRRAHSVPILALSDYTEDEDIARVLRSGADVHFTKPISAVIVEAQASALISRYTKINFADRGITDRGLIFRNGNFSIDYTRRCIYMGNSALKLSAREYDLLSYFLENSGRVLSESQIYERVWKTDKDYHSGLSMPIARLRQKIEPNPQNPVYLQTVRGMGYCFHILVENCEI